MAKPIRTIDVYPNPFSGIDADGVPHGVVQMPGTRNYIGAHLDLEGCKQTGKTRFYYAPLQDNEKGVMGLRRVTVPFTPEVARAVLEGGLIVADAEHARMCGLSGFVSAEKQLLEELARALAERKAQYGDVATIGPIPLEPTPTPTVEAKPAAVDPMLGPPLKGTPLAGPTTNPSLVLATKSEGA